MRVSFDVWGTQGMSVLCVLHKQNYQNVDHSTNEYLYYFVAARNTRASAALGNLAL